MALGSCLIISTEFLRLRTQDWHSMLCHYKRDSLALVCGLPLFQSSFGRLKQKSPDVPDWNWDGKARFGSEIISIA